MIKNVVVGTNALQLGDFEENWIVNEFKANGFDVGNFDRSWCRRGCCSCCGCMEKKIFNDKQMMRFSCGCLALDLSKS